MCTTRKENGRDITIACGDSRTCSSGTVSTSKVLGKVNYDKPGDKNPIAPKRK